MPWVGLLFFKRNKQIIIRLSIKSRKGNKMQIFVSTCLEDNLLSQDILLIQAPKVSLRWCVPVYGYLSCDSIFMFSVKSLVGRSTWDVSLSGTDRCSSEIRHLRFNWTGHWAILPGLCFCQGRLNQMILEVTFNLVFYSIFLWFYEIRPQVYFSPASKHWCNIHCRPGPGSEKARSRNLIFLCNWTIHKWEQHCRCHGALSKPASCDWLSKYMDNLGGKMFKLCLNKLWFQNLQVFQVLFCFVLGVLTKKKKKIGVKKH